MQKAPWARRNRVTSVLAERRPGVWTILDLISVGALVVFAGARYYVGTDYTGYTIIYSALDPFDWGSEVATSPQERGWTILSLLLKQEGQPAQTLFWIASALTVIPIYAVIKQRSTRPGLAVLLYVLLAFYVAPLNIIRQGVASSLNFSSTLFLTRRRWPVFVAINVVASQFHSSVYIAVVIEISVVCLMRWQPTVRLVAAATVGGFLLARVLLSLGPVSTLLTKLNPRYDNYLQTQGVYAGAQAAGLGTYLQIAARIVLLLLAVWMFRERDTPASDDERRWFTYATVGLIALIVGTKTVALARLDTYFGIYLVLLIPNLLAGRKDEGVRRTLLIAAACVYLYNYLGHYAQVVPYRWVL